MKLIVLGANGRTGKLVVKAALDAGMDVTAVVRTADRTPNVRHDRLTVVVGDPCDREFLTHVFRGQDAVISALGGRRPTRAATAVYYRSADALVGAARQSGVERVLVTSTALVFREQTATGRILQLLVPHIVRSAKRMEETLRTSGLSWTSARPGFLSDADEDSYRSRKDGLPKNGTSVSRRALAKFLIDAIDDPKTERAAFGVSNTIA